MLILEADLVSSQWAMRLSTNRTFATEMAQQLRRALTANPWSVLRMSGMFYSKEYASIGPQHQLACSLQCQCSRWAGSELVRSTSPDLQLCEVAAAKSPSDQILPMIAALDSWCDVRDTAAYAVHSSAYGAFIRYLRRLRQLPSWLRNGANDVPAIDNWVPHALPNLYLLPTLVTQPTTANDSQGATGQLRQKSAVQFKQVCADGDHETSLSTSRRVDRKPMKLSSFATRHLYVMKDRAMHRDARSHGHVQGHGQRQRTSAARLAHES